jgi:type I restriction enzyme S subunit
MKSPRPKVRLGEVLRRVERFEARDDLTEYPFAGTYSFARGIFVGERKLGSTFGLPKVQRIRAGDFIYCKIMAWEGAFGIAPAEVDNCVMSGAFVAYEVDSERIDRRFLDYFFKVPSNWQSIGSQSSGTNVRRQSLHPSQFERAEIPLQPLAEQRRVVARIEELAAQIAEACTLRQQAAEEAEALLASWRRTIFGQASRSDWIPLSTYVDHIENGKSPATDGCPASSDEWGVLKVGAVSYGYFDERENKALSATFIVPPSLEVHTGDFIMSRANTRELVGACALVRKTRQKLMLSDKTFRFVFRESRPVLPEFIDQVLKSPPLRDQIEREASGTSPTMKNISKDKVLALRIPPFPLPEQRRIVAELDALQAEVDALKRLQAESTAELDALLPAIFDRAFKGEL